MHKNADVLSQELYGKNAEEILSIVSEKYFGKTVFTTSFGIEDQVITDMIFSNNIDISIITLDTGRLFEETYKVFYNTLEKYNKPIRVYYPEASMVEEMVSNKGPYSFYNSVENRIECCNIRKVEPLRRALRGYACWITGIRAEQSSGRADIRIAEYDEINNIIKVHPLHFWKTSDVEDYLKRNNVPYNSLHDKGYVSIGCEPCTRAIKPSEDFRAGRWWWEKNSGKECGLHKK